MEEDCINRCCRSHSSGFLCGSLQHRTLMEAPEVTSFVSVSVLSLLLVPVVMGWVFLAVRVTWWAVQFSFGVEGSTNISVGTLERSEDLSVSRCDNAFCLDGIPPTTDAEDDNASQDCTCAEKWDDAMKNTLWEEFYGAMGEEELDNLSDYSPR